MLKSLNECVTDISKAIRKGQPIANYQLAKNLDISNNAFAPSQINKGVYGRALNWMLTESLIAKVAQPQANGKGRATTYFKLLRPIEEIEAITVKCNINKHVVVPPGKVKIKQPKLKSSARTAVMVLTIKLHIDGNNVQIKS